MRVTVRGRARVRVRVVASYRAEGRGRQTFSELRWHGDQATCRAKFSDRATAMGRPG